MARATAIQVTLAVLVSLPGAMVGVDAAEPGEKEARPDLRAFESRWVEITGPTLSTVTNIMPPPAERTASDVRARIGLILTNKGHRPFWLVVRLTPPDSNSPCADGFAHLEPKESVEFRCTQETLVADADYPVDIVACADSALADTLERSVARLRFDKRTVRWIEDRLALRRRELEAGKRRGTDQQISLKERLGYGVVLGLSGGVVFPTGEFSNGFGAGGMATTSIGLTGRQFGARLLVGSTEPGARGPTNDAYSARVGSPVEVMEAIVPLEVQGIAAFPAQTSRLGVALHAGAGFHFVTIRVKDTDRRLDEETRVGFSAGAGVRFGIAARDRTVSAGLNGVFHGSGSSRYATAELELMLFW